MTKKEKYKKLKEQGLTYSDIAKKFGVSRQAVHASLVYDYLMYGRGRTRELIRIRDKHTCQECGKKWQEGERRLDVHHKDCIKEKTRKYDVYEIEKDNMITLCHKCHLNIPEHKKKMSRNNTKSLKGKLKNNKKKIIKMLKIGYTQVEIAKEYKTTPQSVNKFIKKLYQQ